MIDEKYELVEAGISMSQLTELDEGIEIAIDNMIEDVEYEPNDRDGLSDALRDECYKHMIEFAEMEETDEWDDALVTKFQEIKSDFVPDNNDHSKASLSIMLGSRCTKDVDPSDVQRDIMVISSKLMEENYSR